MSKDYNSMSYNQLKSLVGERKIPGRSKLTTKQKMIEALSSQPSVKEETPKQEKLPEKKETPTKKETPRSTYPAGSYQRMTKKELLKEAEELGISLPLNFRNDEIINILEAMRYAPLTEKLEGKGSSAFQKMTYTVLKQVHPDLGITSESLTVMKALAEFALAKIVDRASPKSFEDVRQLLEKNLQGEISKHAVSEVYKLVKRQNAKAEQGEKYIYKENNPRFDLFVKNRYPQLDSRTAEYLGIALEYLFAEILELSGNKSRDAKRQRITPANIYLVIVNDEELYSLFYGLINKRMIEKTEEVGEPFLGKDVTGILKSYV